MLISSAAVGILMNIARQTAPAEDQEQPKDLSQDLQ
jgi:hypothetical protein